MAAFSSREQSDCLILQDDETSGQLMQRIKTKLKQKTQGKSNEVVKHITEQLQAHGVSLRFHDKTPGSNRQNTLNIAIKESDTILLVIDRAPSCLFEQTISQVCRHLQQKTIIPLFCDIPPTEQHTLLDRPPLMSLQLLHHVVYGEPNFMDSIITVITEPDLSERLMETYRRELPVGLSPLAAGSFPQGGESAHVYIPPHCKARRLENNSRIVDKKLENTTDLLELLRDARTGDLFVTDAVAGLGKSTMLCHTAIKWHECHPHLARYKYLFLIPIRRITNHKEALERILTRDIELLPESQEGKVRRSLKFRSQDCLLLIDGFDEINDIEREITVLNHILSKKIIKDAVVMITTRPNCREHVVTECNGSFIDLPLYRLDNDGIKSYIYQVFSGNEEHGALVRRTLLDMSIPKEIMAVPLFLAILCCLCRDQLATSGSLDEVSQLRTTGSILATFWGVLLQVKHQKTSGGLKVITSLIKKKMEHETQRLLNVVAKMCFDCLEKGLYIFSESTLDQYYLSDEDLTQLGPIDVKTRGQKTAMFVHASFQEYCAGIHIARDEMALQRVVNEWRGQALPTKTFNRYKNAMIYAVGIDCEVLSKLPSDCFRLKPLQGKFYEYDSCTSCYIDLSMESLLLQECLNGSCRDEFLRRILLAPVDEPQTVDALFEINAPAYEAMLSGLGYTGCLEIVKRVYTGRSPSHLQLPVISPLTGDEQTIGDPLLLCVLADVYLDRTAVLWVQNASQQIMQFAKECQIQQNVVSELFIDRCEIRLNDIVTLIRAVGPSAGIEKVWLYAHIVPGETTHTSEDVPSVGTLNIHTNIKLSTLAAITSCLKIETLCLHECRIVTEDDHDRKYTLENVSTVKILRPHGVHLLAGRVLAASVKKVYVDGWVATRHNQSHALTKSQLQEIFLNADNITFRCSSLVYTVIHDT